MKHIVLSDGFELDVDDQTIADDMEFFDALVEFDKGDKTKLPYLVNAILGDNKPRFYERCRTESGRVSTTAVMAGVAEIITSISKN